MRSVGGSRWRVTSPRPCPHFHAQQYVYLSFVAVSRCVTRHRILLLPMLFSSCGDDRRAVAPVHPRGNPAGHVPGEIVHDGAAGFCGNSPNMSFGRKQLLWKGDTNCGKRCIASTQNYSHSTFIPYRMMPLSSKVTIGPAESSKLWRCLVGHF